MTPHLQIELLPLTGGIAAMFVASLAAVVMVRRLRHEGGAGQASLLTLSLMVVNLIQLMAIAFIVAGLFE